MTLPEQNLKIIWVVVFYFNCSFFFKSGYFLMFLAACCPNALEPRVWCYKLKVDTTNSVVKKHLQIIIYNDNVKCDLNKLPAMVRWIPSSKTPWVSLHQGSAGVATGPRPPCKSTTNWCATRECYSVRGIHLKPMLHIDNHASGWSLLQCYVAICFAFAARKDLS